MPSAPKFAVGDYVEGMYVGCYPISGEVVRDDLGGRSLVLRLDPSCVTSTIDGWYSEKYSANENDLFWLVSANSVRRVSRRAPNTVREMSYRVMKEAGYA